MPSKRSLIALSLLAAFVTTACSPHVQAQQPPKQKPQAQPPLASFASQRLILLPVQMLRADSGSFVTMPMWAEFRKTLDDSVAAAISDRGIGKGWGYAADVLRQAKRNAAYVGDPYALGAQPLRGQLYKPNDHIPDVMSNNLRGLIALGDTRYALVPIELVIQRDGPRQRAVLRLALIDGRSGLFMWVGEAASDPMTALTPALINTLAARVADLVVAR